MTALQVLSGQHTPPGIDIKGLPTIDVIGHEVSVADYFHVVELWEANKSVSHIVSQVLIRNESAPVSRKVMAVIVKAILKNLEIMNGQSIVCPTPKLGSLIFNHLKPKKIISHRALRLASENDLSESFAKLQIVQRKESKVINETLRITAQRDSVSRIMADGWDRRKTEASLDVEVREYLKKHHALETELAYARRLVELNLASHG